MPKSPALCPRRCGRTSAPGRRLCTWCALSDASPQEQEEARRLRLGAATQPHRARVPAAEWPPGHRWCAGCQSMIPLEYTSGSRCKACASTARHASAMEAVYGITEAQYQRMFEIQGGRCAICQRIPRNRRLAVDHDHKTGAPRGLLCGGDGYTCNMQIVGTLEGATGNDRAKMLVAAKRLVQYLTETPYEYMERTS